MQRNISFLMQNEEFLSLCEAIIPTVLTGLTVSILQYFEFSNWFSAVIGGTVGALAVNSLDKQKIARRKVKWEEYSAKHEGTLTIDAFKRHDLSKYLNTACGAIQFGTSTGNFLKIFRDVYHKKVVGYDFTNSSIKKLNEKNIPARKIDLNSINEQSATLAYQYELNEDLTHPANILLIRILNHLNIKAMNLLLSYIITNTKPGSVIFIAGDINKKTQYENAYSGLTKNYKASFFAARTDMEILKMENKPDTSNTHHQTHYDEEIVVVRKRS